MIRFSAGLVVVAIGVLIGGVATSKLSLVYVAIAVSAVALVALAIGVALKRDELFGGGPETVPAKAGADSGIPVGQSAGPDDVRGSGGRGREDQPKIRPTGPATAAFEAAAAAASKSAAAPTVAAPSVTTPPVPTPPVASSPVTASSAVNPPLGQRQHAFSQASTRVDETVADWDTRPPQPQPQPPWSSGDQGRPIWTAREQAPTRPSSNEPQSGSAPAASAPARGRDTSADQQAPPSWFDRLNQPFAAPDTAEPSPADRAKAEPPKAFAAKTSTPDDDSSTATPSAAASADAGADDDDWPTRYSWLEDEETDETAEPEADKKPGAAAETVAANTVSPDTVPAKTVTEKATMAEPASTDAHSPDEATTGTGTDDPPAPQATGAKLVTVIPGVPRYHEPDCILIRFMDEADIARKSIPEAEAANCTPCAACQPEG